MKECEKRECSKRCCDKERNEKSVGKVGPIVGCCGEVERKRMMEGESS